MTEINVNKQEVTLEDLERLVTAMVAAIPSLECPECCEQNWKYQYVELSAQLYLDEWEWACLARAMAERRAARCKAAGAPPSGSGQSSG